VCVFSWRIFQLAAPKAFDEAFDEFFMGEGDLSGEAALGPAVLSFIALSTFSTAGLLTPPTESFVELFKSSFKGTGFRSKLF
jgi:hypothetical protein